MLILSRKCNESILVGENIEIIVTEISGDKVKLGIKAPGAVTILRKELFLTIEDNRAASKAVDSSALKKMLDGLKPKA